jgi:molybdopterin synthase sulfur carrier subunit
MTDARLRILYFAWLRERVGRSEEEVDLPAEVRNVGALLTWLQARGANYQRAFAVPGVVRCAVNQVFAGPEAPVSPGDEVAFFPPVTGG